MIHFIFRYKIPHSHNIHNNQCYIGISTTSSTQHRFEITTIFSGSRTVIHKFTQSVKIKLAKTPFFPLLKRQKKKPGCHPPRACVLLTHARTNFPCPCRKTFGLAQCGRFFVSNQFPSFQTTSLKRVRNLAIF